MSKYRSRATRLSEAISDLELLKDNLQNYLDSMDEDEDGSKIKESTTETFPEESIEDSKSEIECLMEEIESWYDNMTGTNLENTEKYSMLEECKDSLDNLISSFPDDEISENSSVDEIESFIQTLEETINEADSIEFPGMF